MSTGIINLGSYIVKANRLALLLENDVLNQHSQTQNIAFIFTFLTNHLAEYLHLKNKQTNQTTNQPIPRGESLTYQASGSTVSKIHYNV
jgi:hypothetical protein